MAIKWKVSGAKARNGTEIVPMEFDNKRAAERFALYHEGITVKQNLRKHPGVVTAVAGSGGEPAQTEAAPVGKAAGPLTKAIQINDDLEEAYAMGYRQAVANAFWKGAEDDDVETQDYVDQRRSDLKELTSFDRSLT